MKISATVKGELEQFIIEQKNIRGVSAAQVLVDTAYQGYFQKKAVESLPELSKAINEMALSIKSVEKGAVNAQ